MTDTLTSEANNDVAESIKISNSGVSTWLVCQKQYYYRYDLGLEANTRSEALDRGVLGHEVLAVYYKAIQRGISHDDAVKNAEAFLGQFMAGGSSFDLGIVLDVHRVLSGYWPIAAKDNWRILQVEEEFNVFLTPEFDFTMRLDLLVHDLDDGKIKIVDHKFVYNFKTEEEVSLDPQLPKYIGALRANNVKVDEAVFNQLRYRKIKDPAANLYARKSFVPSNSKVVNIIRDQITASQEIVKWKALPLETRAKHSKRILNLMVCRGCSMKLLCAAELDGAPIDYLVATEYKKKEHNSSEPTSAELEQLI